MHVYILQRPDGLIKIGFSTDPTKRLRSLETQGGFDAASAWVSVPVENAKAVEAKAHEKLAEHRVIGEWFKADFDDAIQTVIDALSGKFADEIGASCSVEEAERIAAALGVTLQDLLSPASSDESSTANLTGHFARYVRDAMKASGVTQAALAAAAGVSQANISDIVNSEKSPSLSTVQKICEVLDLGCVLVSQGGERDVSRAADILAHLTTAQRAQAIRMLEAFAASCAPEDTE